MKTQCTSLAVRGAGRIAAGERASAARRRPRRRRLREGQRQTSASPHIDAGCVVHHVSDFVGRIAEGVLDAITASATLSRHRHRRGGRRHQHEAYRYTTFAIPPRQERQGSASTARATSTRSQRRRCTKVPLVLIGSPCRLQRAGGWKRSELVTIKARLRPEPLPERRRGPALHDLDGPLTSGAGPTVRALTTTAPPLRRVRSLTHSRASTTRKNLKSAGCLTSACAKIYTCLHRAPVWLSCLARHPRDGLCDGAARRHPAPDKR